MAGTVKWAPGFPSAEPPSARGYVCWCRDVDDEMQDQYFSTYQEAVEAAQAIQDSGQLCIWRMEKGEYENNAGRWQVGWVYRWWSPRITSFAAYPAYCTSDHKPPDPDRCIPDDRQFETAFRRVA